MSQGWQCPACGVCYAPWVYACPCRTYIPATMTTYNTPPAVTYIDIGDVSGAGAVD